MHKVQLAAALAAVLGLTLHGTANAADNGMTVTEKTTKTEKSVKIADKAATEKGAEAACKSKEGACKSKEGACKSKEGSCKTKKEKTVKVKKTKKEKDGTTTTESKETKEETTK